MVGVTPLLTAGSPHHTPAIGSDTGPGVGTTSPTTGPTDAGELDWLAPRAYQPAALYPTIRPSWVAPEHDALWAYVNDAGFDPYPPEPAPAPPAAVHAATGTLSETELRAILTEAGWPAEWHDDALAIAWCESHWSPYAVGDGGNSLGAWQLWRGWFGPAGYSVDQAFDPLTNARVALYVRQVRGRFGGAGGWSCAERMGIE